MSSFNDLTDYISLFIICPEKALLLTMELNSSEFWLPGRKVPLTSNIESELRKEMVDIFGYTISIQSMLTTTSVSIPGSKPLNHYVFLLQCKAEDRRNIKNSKKYRGKIRWMSAKETYEKLTVENQKSLELSNYVNAFNGRSAAISYGIYAFDCPNFLEINENLLINLSDKSAFSVLMDVAGFNKTVQTEVLKKIVAASFPMVFLNETRFANFLNSVGCTSLDSSRLFRCADIAGKGNLSYREVLCVLAAIEPLPKTGISPNSECEMRNFYVFRYFDVDQDLSLSFDELKTLVDVIKKAKDQNSGGSQNQVELCFKSCNTDRLTLQNYTYLVSQSILKSTTVLLRSNASFKSNSKGSNSNVKGSGNLLQQKIPSKPTLINNPRADSRNPTSLVALPSKQKAFEVSLHAIMIEPSGEFLLARQIWDLGDAFSGVITKDNAAIQGEQTTRISINNFDLTNVCHKFLSDLRWLYHENRNTYHLKKKDSFFWTKIDKARYVENILQICDWAQKILSAEPRLIYVQSPVYVMGDLHGNFQDIISFERCFWSLSPHLCPGALLFLGDYVDRGHFSLEVAMYLLCNKVLSPNKVILLRGNHEIRDIQRMFTFVTYLTECSTKLGEKGSEVWKAINNAFDCLPLAAIIDYKIFCCHGGIPPPWLCPVVAAINKIPPVLNDPDLQSSLAWNMLWNDPVRESHIDNDLQLELDTNEGFAQNVKRGTAHVFDTRALNNFFAVNGLTHMIRAHEAASCGFTIHRNYKLFTVFSSSSYCGGNNEAGCILVYQGMIRMFQLNNGRNHLS